MFDKKTFAYFTSSCHVTTHFRPFTCQLRLTLIVVLCCNFEHRERNGCACRALTIFCGLIHIISGIVVSTSGISIRNYYNELFHKPYYICHFFLFACRSVCLTPQLQNILYSLVYSSTRAETHERQH